MGGSVCAVAFRLVLDLKMPHRSSGDARVAVLFSGGLDSICLAALADRHIPQGEPIDLLNVAFENSRVQNAASETTNKDKKAEAMVNGHSTYDVPDRFTGRRGVEELRYEQA